MKKNENIQKYSRIHEQRGWIVAFNNTFEWVVAACWNADKVVFYKKHQIIRGKKSSRNRTRALRVSDPHRNYMLCGFHGSFYLERHIFLEWLNVLRAKWIITSFFFYLFAFVSYATDHILATALQDNRFQLKQPANCQRGSESNRFLLIERFL